MIQTIGSTNRTKALKTSLVLKACYNGKYSDDIFVDVSRAKYYMESYKETEGEDSAIRRAKALLNVLSNISISILDNELIVGNPHSSPCALPIFPEQNTVLLQEAIEDKYINNEDIELAKELISYWQNKTIAKKVSENMSEETMEIVNTASSFISTTWKDGIQHCVPNWDFTFANGTTKIKKMIQTKLDEVFEIIDKGNSTDLSNKIDMASEYKAMLISIEALETFIDRYRDLALEMSVIEKDSKRRAELEAMAQMLSTTLREKPSSFHEACQGFFFLHLILNCIDSAAFGSLIRIDQTLYPFFKKDKEIKGMKNEEMQEIVECLILKVQALGAFFSRNRRLHFEGNGALPIWTVGGILQDGTDACNELTDTILKAARTIKCNQPTISIMYHKEMREQSLVEAIETVKSGLGFPSFTNTNWMVDSLMGQGMPLEVARNSGVVGCVSCCPVDCCNTTKRLALTIIASKCFELALNRGVCPVTKKKIGPDEKDPTEFKSVDEIMTAFRKQLAYATTTAVNVRNLARHYEKQDRPNPLVSSFHKSPIEKGIDAVEYEDIENNYWMNMVGLVNVVNSLAVLKQMVFEEKKYTINDFIDALNSNWEDKEVMRQQCLNKVPKYGNDNDFVDSIATEVFSIASDVAKHTYDINGGYWSILAQSVSIYQSTAKMTGAMPDGKKQGMPVADGGVSPDHGSDSEGVFAVLSSDGKINHADTKGLLLNQWISPELLKGEEGLQWMKSLLSMWDEKKISQMQLNIVDPEILKDAQINPEKHQNLTVRVSGYTANWVQLTKELQDIILSRTCQTRI